MASKRRVLFEEDDARPIDAETVSAAYRRLFGAALHQEEVVEEYEANDGTRYRRTRRALVVTRAPGEGDIRELLPEERGEWPEVEGSTPERWRGLQHSAGIQDGSRVRVVRRVLRVVEVGNQHGFRVFPSADKNPQSLGRLLVAEEPGGSGFVYVFFHESSGDGFFAAGGGVEVEHIPAGPSLRMQEQLETVVVLPAAVEAPVGRMDRARADRILAELLECAQSWMPDAPMLEGLSRNPTVEGPLLDCRVLGNVRAQDLVEALVFVRDELRKGSLK